MRELIRKCPSCGRRFVVRLETKKLVGAKEGTERITHDIRLDAGMQLLPAGSASEDVPVKQETYNMTFECRSCHHSWTETITKVEEGR